MGQQLMKFYENAFKLGGLPARVALAKHTGIPGIAAQDVPDTPEKIKIFEAGLAKIKLEFSNSNAPAAHDELKQSSANVQKFTQAHAKLLAEINSYNNDVNQIATRITETAAATLGVARASVWRYDGSAIECLDLFENSSKKHSKGLKLTEKDFPPYFSALKLERAIDADDAHVDLRTSCFSAPYLKPLGINSMLDIPIWARARMAGVLCHEHIGPKRIWTNEEADFGVLLASILTKVI